MQATSQIIRQPRILLAKISSRIELRKETFQTRSLSIRTDSRKATSSWPSLEVAQATEVSLAAVASFPMRKE